MKHMEFVGTLREYESKPCSVYGNPKFAAVFENENGEVLSGTTATDAACAYGFLNFPENPRKVTYHVTRKGNVIFDYVKVLAKEGE